MAHILYENWNFSIIDSILRTQFLLLLLLQIPYTTTLFLKIHLNVSFTIHNNNKKAYINHNKKRHFVIPPTFFFFCSQKDFFFFFILYQHAIHIQYTKNNTFIFISTQSNREMNIRAVLYMYILTPTPLVQYPFLF